MSHFQFDETELHAGYCGGASQYTANGDCSNQHYAFQPDVPPALLTAAPVSAARLEQILGDPTYANYGIVIYRFPADSLQPEIQLLKRDGVWMVLKFTGPQKYQPASRVVSPREIVALIWNYVRGEQVYPPEVELIGTGPSKHRVFFRLA